jgi:biopolymer transport protein TolR
VSPSQGGETGIISGINVTPLVDITLVLLIIFIVTAKIIVTPAVPLDLPRAASTEEVQAVFSVIVPERGATTVNGQPMPDNAALGRQAREALSRDPELRAVIQADGGVTHRRVIAVLDALKQAGVARIAFGALSPDVTSP